MKNGILALVPLLAPLACVTAHLSEQDRDSVMHKYTGQVRELPTSLYATKFFVESTRKLLSVQPPDEVDILEDTHGNPIVPGLAQEVIPAGTKVTIVRVSFPSFTQNFVREFTTPRDRIWVDLAVEGKPASPVYTLVLRPDLKSQADVDTEMDKLLTDKPLDAEIKTLSPADQRIIATKDLAAGPTARGLELAFGEPNVKQVTININAGVTTKEEDLTWRTDTAARKAHLKNGVVVTVEGPPVKRDAAK